MINRARSVSIKRPVELGVFDKLIESFKSSLEKLIVDKPKGYFDLIKGWFKK